MNEAIGYLILAVSGGLLWFAAARWRDLQAESRRLKMDRRDMNVRHARQRAAFDAWEIEFMHCIEQGSEPPEPPHFEWAD